MKNINKLIIETLKPLNIPISYLYSDIKEDTFITFSNYNEYDTDYSDNESNTTNIYIQVNIWSKEVNFIKSQENIINLLSEAGFIKRAIGPTLSYKEYGLYQKPLRFLFYLKKNNQEVN